MSNFAKRFLELAEKRSPLCIGIDPSVELLRQWKLPLDANGLGKFCDLVIEAADELVAVVKPQSAFFERFGPDGLRELARIVQNIRKRGALSLIDCKRGDIGHTLEAYADAMIGPDSPFYADAITVSPYLGFDTLQPMFKKAAAVGAGIFVVVQSSNPEGRALQSARLADGRTIVDGLADSITQFNASLDDDIGPVGAVIGATSDETIKQTLVRLPKSLLLAPGIGAQGATFDSLAFNFGDAVRRTLPAISRGILASGPSVAGLRKAINEHRDQAFRLFERSEAFIKFVPGQEKR